jgi:hypothetical protein
MVDASANHVGAAFQQRPSSFSSWQPLGFFSKKVNPAQQRYSAFDRELLACTAGIRHFRHILEGCEFSILKDHKPITFALARATDAWTQRQGCHLSYIAEYTSYIRNIPGKENVVADTMSRPPAAPRTVGPVGAHTARPDSCLTAGPASAHTAGPDSSAWLEETLAGLNSLTAEVPPACAAEINFLAMAAAQPRCGDTQAARRSFSLQVVNQWVAGTSTWCDISTGKARPLVPACHRRQVFAALHGMAHPGIRASRRLISQLVSVEGDED